MLAGYINSFSIGENNETQESVLLQKGCSQIYKEEIYSSGERPQLQVMLKEIKAGDTIAILKLQVLADSLLQLFEILKEMDGRGINLLSIEEKLDTRPGNDFSFFESAELVINFQRDSISQNTKSGLVKAVQNGSKIGRPRKSDEKIDEALAMYQSKNFTINEITKKTEVGKTTLYRYLKD